MKKKQLEKLKNVSAGPTTLVKDYKENYNETNMRNWAMFVGICLVCISFANIFMVPTSAEGLLMIRDKKLEEAKLLLNKFKEVAKDLNDERRKNIIRENVREEEEKYNKLVKEEQRHLQAKAAAAAAEKK